MPRWFLASLLVACAAPTPETGDLVLRLQPLGGDERPLRSLLDAFERGNPGIHVRTQLIPNATDLAHQMLLTDLEGGSTTFDVFVADIVWIPELAKAGWIADLTQWFPPSALSRDFFEGVVRADVFDGRTCAVPWYLDAGVLYYRTDLVPRAPKTYDELEAFARVAQQRAPGISGLVWQGRQSESLVCNVDEVIWGFGGRTEAWGRAQVESAEATRALRRMRGWIESGLSPSFVLSATEEESRRAFQSGRAVFMRNWPYAWAEAEAPGSPIRGEVAIAPLPTLDGHVGEGVMGGWQLAINRRIPAARQALAAKLIAMLTSPDANRILAHAYGRNPPRRAIYRDPAFRADNPFIASLEEIIAHARPRPITPFYNLVADTVQSGFSAAISGVRPPERALRETQSRIDAIQGARQ